MTEIVPNLPDYYNPRSGHAYPTGLIGAKVIGFGTTAERIKRVEGGGLVIDYKPPQSETVKRLHLGFNETGMWIESQ